MSDINDRDIERLLGELSKFAPALGNLNKTMSDKRKADDDMAKATTRASQKVWQFDTKLGEAKESLAGFVNGADSAVKFFTKSLLAPLGAKAFMGVAAFTALWSAGKNLNDTWKEMADIGQTFNGSMFTMSAAASAAGLPLDTFARLQKANNVLINATGKQFWQVNKQLSANVIKSGMYGLSLDQLGDFTAAYMETARKNGSLQHRSTGQLVGDMNDLILSTTALASQSDKTRQEIANLANSAMNSALAIAGIRSLPTEIRGSVGKAISEATTVFASLPGKAGEYLANFFADTTGVGSVFTSGGKTAIDAGLSGLASQMDETARAVKDGRVNGTEAAIDVQNKIIKEVNNNIEFLKIQAASGNQAAAEMIEMFAGMEPLTRKQLQDAKEQAKRTESITALMASIDTIWQKIKSSFGASFADALGKTFNGFHNFAESKVIEKLMAVAGAFGARLGDLLGRALTDTNIDALASGIENVIGGMLDLFTSFANAKPIWTMVGSAFAVIAKTVGAAVGVFNSLGPSVQKTIGALVGGAIILGGIRKIFSGLFGKNMMVNAQTVIVNGGVGGGFGGAGGAGKGGIRGALRNASRLARSGARLGGLGGGLAGLGRGIKGIGGAAGGTLGRLAPWLGVGLESIDYITGSKALNWRNLTKSGLALGGGALGAVAGGALGGVGAIGGGIGGYAGGQALGNWLLGPDTPVASAAEATSKAADATSKAAASIAATNQAMAKSDDSANALSDPTVDPMQVLIDEIKDLRTAIQRSLSVNSSKLDTANRLLSKIEISAQSL